MKKSFLEQLEDVTQAAQDFIKDKVKAKGKFVLATDQELEENSDLLYELPNISTVSRHGYYIEYAIVSLEKRDEDIYVQTIEKGEDSDEEEFNLSKVDNICTLADYISEM